MRPLRPAPGGRINTVVEEILRYLSVADGAGRFATKDVELGGVHIRGGDGLVVAISAANRDPRPQRASWAWMRRYP